MVRFSYEPHWRPSTGFRSALEASVAAELTRQHVVWRYEEPVEIDGVRIRYLPDFLILGSCHEDEWGSVVDDPADLNETHPAKALDLPKWIECKPQDMLYSLRDELGVTRKVGERFSPDEDVVVDSVKWEHLTNEELRKPKALAEKTGESVLLVGGVNGTTMLTATMSPSSVSFSRGNRFVNATGVARRIEREEQRARWAEQAERYRQESEERERERQRAAAPADGGITTRAKALGAQPIKGTPKYASDCYACHRRGIDGNLYRPKFSDGSERWVRLCQACIARVGS